MSDEKSGKQNVYTNPKTYRKLKTISMGLRILRVVLIGYFILNFHQFSLAQCPGGVAPLQYVQSSNTGINGDSEAFPFDQFDPSLGTLIGVNIHAKITGLIKMSVINYNTTPKSFNVEVDRTDYFTAPGLGVEIIVDTTVTYATPLIAAAQYPGTAPTYYDRIPNDDGSNINDRYIAAPVDVTVDQQITDPLILTNYTGSGVYTIDYELQPGYSVKGSGASQTQASITTFSTQVELVVIYIYCPHSVLADNNIQFDVTKKLDGLNALLTWTKEQEENGILYIPEVSTNGNHFSAIGNLHSQKPVTDGTVVKYEFDYAFPSGNQQKLYFRVKQLLPDGTVIYSPVKTLQLNGISEATASIYPNPAETGFTIRFAKPVKKQLQALIVNSAGQTVENVRISLNGAQQHHIQFSKKHPKGIYFLKLIEAGELKSEVLKLLIK